MKVPQRIFGRGLCSALLLLLAVSNAVAQQTGTLRGQVKDEFGGVIISATVSATNASGAEKNTVTDADGNFALGGLAPGKYTVRVVSPGFALYENAEVSVAAGRGNEPLAVTLGVSLDREEVTVASESPLNLDSPDRAGAIVLRGKDLEALPDDPEDLAAALQALAGPAAGPNGGQITIDGFEGGRIPPRDSIREVRVNENPLSAERDQPGFGGIQILTKPGTDRLRGSVFTTFMDESLNSRNPFAERRADFQSRQFGGNLSGTIIPKRASFFFDFERSATDDNDIINATVLDDPLQPPTRFVQTVLTPARRVNTSLRGDYQINQSNTLVARYNYFRNKQQNLGVSTFSLPERAFDQSFHTHTLQLTETAILNKTTINETRFQFIRNRRDQDPLNDALAINVIDAFTSGGATVGDSFNEDSRYELTNQTTIAHGKHSTKFGARLRAVRVSDFSEANFNGTFTFTSLDQYQRTLNGVAGARPAQLLVSAGEPLAEVSQVDFGGFVQDDWKLRPNLTVGAGLRYETQSNISSHFNFAPRFFVSWSPDGSANKTPKTVIRLGVGIFYDRVFESLTLQANRFDGSGQEQFIITEPLPGDTSERAVQARAILGQFPVVSLDALRAFNLPQVTRRLADDIRAPYSYTGGLIIERQLPKKFTLSSFMMTYNTRHLLRSRNVNAPLDGVRPDPSKGDIYQYESSGTQNLRQFNIGLRNQINPAFTVFTSYTYFKAENDAEGAFSFPANSYDASNEYGRASFDTRHRVHIGGNIAVPYLKLLLNPLVFINTGRPFNITTGIDNNQDGIFNDRPAFADAQTPACTNPNPRSCDLQRTPYGDFDIRPKAGQTIIPRNFAEGPGFFSVNLRISRAFGFGDMPGAAAARAQAGGGGTQGGQQGGGRQPAGAPAGQGGGNRQVVVGGPGGGPGGGPMMAGGGGGGEQKRYTMTFSVFFTNLFNRANLSNPVGNLSSPSFGRSLTTAGGFGGFGGGNPAAGNRKVQASVRLNF